METIRFYRTRDPYGCFSNFSRHPITIDKMAFATSEHYFQWMKHASVDPAHAERIRSASTPKEAVALARDRAHPMRPDWDAVKDDVMRLAVLHKFAQHDDCRAELLGTGGATLIEATTDDYYWGEGTERTGKNMLGVILMEVRAVLRDEDIFQTRIDGAHSPMEEDALANLPSPGAEYEREIRVRLGLPAT